MNDVEPFAPILNWVFSVSSNVETKRNVIRGHQPGNGKRVGQRLAAHNAASAVISATKNWIRI
jgi:hypothetical protein